MHNFASKKCHKYNQSYEVDLFCRTVWLTVQQVKGIYLIRRRWSRYVFSLSLLLITVRRNEQKCQVIPSTLKFLKQHSKSVFSLRQTLLPYGNKFNLSNVNIRKRISNYRLPKIFHRIQHRKVKRKVHSKVHRKVKRKVFSFFALSSYQD